MSTPTKRRRAPKRTGLVLFRWAMFGLVFGFGLSLVWLFAVGESLFSMALSGPFTYGDLLLLVGVVVGMATGLYLERR